MRTPCLLRSILFAGLCSVSVGALAQCTNNNTAIAGGAITPACPGTTNVPCVQGGQYALINVVSGNQYTFATCGASFDTQITLFNNAGGASLGFNDDSGTCGLFSLQSYIAWTATFTGQLRVLVDLYNCATNATCAPLAITCSSPPPPVTNADPCGSTAIPLTNPCAGVTYSNVGGGNSATTPTPTCGNFIGGSQDVWFSFVAGPLGTVSLQSNAGTLTDGAMAVYSAPSCSGPFALISCDDDSGPGLMPQLGLSGLTPGQTYYVRYWGFGAATGTFTLCAQGLTTAPAGDCVYTLNMYDAFGDGWGASTVGISTNGGVSFTYYTVTGTFNQAVFGVTIGSQVWITYQVNGAPFQGEISYTLALGASALFNSGSPPAAGLVYASTVSCVPPPSPPEDCVGAITICNNQSFNNNTTSTGNTADLNAANYGCLATAERQGTWYVFSPSASGSIGLNIDPVGPDDYDFAIWGPYPPGSTPTTMCPPAAQPIRCTFASGPSTFTATGDYNTGMGHAVYSPPQFANPGTSYGENPAGDGWVPGIDVIVDQVYLMYISNWDQTGLAFSLSWTLANGASLDCTQLGVEFLDLRATADGDATVVEWSTTSERQSSHFIIERATDAVHFEGIGSLDAHGGPGITTDYRFLDPWPMTGVNYYRLKEVDQAGGNTNSEVVDVFFGTATDEIHVVPNPAQNSTTLYFTAGGSGQGRVELLDARGRVAMDMMVPLFQGQDRVTLSLLDLEPGPYILRLSGPNMTTRHTRLVRLR